MRYLYVVIVLVQRYKFPELLDILRTEKCGRGPANGLINYNAILIMILHTQFELCCFYLISFP